MSEDLTCHVCAQTVTDRGLLADCDSCGKLYHLNPRSDTAGIDCGDVWAGVGDAPVLQFFCQPCLDAVRGQALAEGVPATPPGMPPLPPGAPPEALAALAGLAVPAAPPGPSAPPDGPAPGTAAPPAPATGGSSQPPRLGARPRQRRRFRRIDA